MKKADAIQLVVLVIALLLLYNALITASYFLWLIYHWFAEGLTMAERFSNVALNFLFITFDAIVGLLLIKKSKLLAEKIADAGSFSADINVFLKKKDIVFATLIGLGCYILLTKLPKLLAKSYDYIKEKNNGVTYDGPNFTLPGESIFEFLLATIMAVILLVYAKTFTDYLCGQIEKSDKENIEDEAMLMYPKKNNDNQ